MSSSATYFKKNSSIKHDVTVNKKGTQLIIEGICEYNVDSLTVETFPSTIIVTLANGEVLNFSPNEWSKLGIQMESNALHDWRFAALGLVTLFLALFFVLPPYLNSLVDKLPADKKRNFIRNYVLDKKLLNGCETSADKKYFKSAIAKIDSVDTDQIKLVVQEMPMLNAFALPGEVIVISKKLIESIKKEEEFLAVLAHEIGHIKLGHHTDIIVKNFIYNQSIKIFTGNEVSFISTYLSQRYSSNLEREADLFAIESLKNNGINPRHGAEFFRKILNSPGNSLIEKLIPTHPPSQERIDLFSSQTGRYTPLFWGDWNAFQNGLCGDISLQKNIDEQEKECIAGSVGKVCDSLALELINKKRYVELEKFIKTACVISNDPISCTRYGFAKIKQGKFDEGLKYYTKSCDLKDAIGCYNYYVNIKDLNMAEGVRYLKKACKLDDAESCFYLGYELSIQNEEKEVYIPYFKKGCKLKDDQACLWWATKAEGSILEEERISALDLSCKSKNQSGCFHLGETYLKMGDKDQARRLFKKSCDFGYKEACPRL